MDTGTIVNIILSILSFALAAISVITVVITLKQNNKMLEANSRPYVVAYLVYDEYACCVYLCVKNFGNTSAVVKSMTIDPGFNLHTKTCNEVMADTMLAPNQQFHFLALNEDRNDRFEKENYVATVTMRYVDCSSKKEYTETYKISTEYTNEILSVRPSKSNLNQTENSLRNIEHILSFNKNSNM